ncbi:hypothetical protein Tco_1109948 [Tanacetum coccineum]|uniref:Uncharacterized protein n=1 Tax=Tanacetum coccineum TaxID=301880 RepID=A0ABQ5IHF1_9ASTR
MRVEDLQLGVESYQKELNLTKPVRIQIKSRNKTHTLHNQTYGSNIVGSVQEEKDLYGADELSQFSDGNSMMFGLRFMTLCGIRMDYLPTVENDNIFRRKLHKGYLDIGKLNRIDGLNGFLTVVAVPDESSNDEVLKLKNIKKDGYIRFQHQEQYEHVGPEVTRSQEGKRSQDDDKRLCLVDDLKEFKITFMSSQ